MEIIQVPKSAFVTPETIQSVIDEIECIYKKAGNVSYAGVNALKCIKMTHQSILDSQPTLASNHTNLIQG